jgi:hypothetical protein
VLNWVGVGAEVGGRALRESADELPDIDIHSL